NWLLVPNFDLAQQAPALVDTVLDMLHSPALRLMTGDLAR
ncbi:MAG: TetR family transcriptional regulator, partial [Pseudomonas sp.]|nr:TetR family transcriptional regulator [Pseudomonas sp.]